MGFSAGFGLIMRVGPSVGVVVEDCVGLTVGFLVNDSEVDL